MTKKIKKLLHLPTVNEFNSDLTVTLIYVRQLNTEIVSLKALQLLHQLVYKLTHKHWPRL